MEKMSLYKFTHIPLIKNNAQKVTSKKKKRNHPNLLKNKNLVLKIKICLDKQKKKKEEEE